MIGLLLVSAVGLFFLLLWELYICEGTHLGRKFVVWMYDLTAPRYNRIKAFDEDWEERFLGEPVANIISQLPNPRLLDAGAGTGRLASTLLPLVQSHGVLFNLEPSKRMIVEGLKRIQSRQSQWVRAFAVPLPFDENRFDLVVCLEVLEFTPNPGETLQELKRVLKPGGWLLVTNRIGWEAAWILGKTSPKEVFIRNLVDLGFHGIEILPWQKDYDLAWARKTFAI